MPGTLARLSGVLDAAEFGVKMSGKADESDALQRAIDAAHAQRRILLIPGGVALIAKPLRLTGRSLRLLGTGMDRTVLRAAAPMAAVLDVRETSDKIVSPFEVEGLTIDAANKAKSGIAVRYRHHSVMRDLLCINADVGIDETDCWLSRRYNCRSERHRIGWRIQRNGHSSVWDACSFVGCSEAHLDVDTIRTDEPSSALTFRGCDVEFGSGIGVRVGKGAVVAFENCYIGENIDSVVFDNAGNATVSGGVVFFGNKPGAALVRPAGGMLRLRDLRVSGQAHGVMSSLVADGGNAGRIELRGITPAFPIAGDPTLPGDPIGGSDATSQVAANGSAWQPFSARGPVERSRTSADGVSVRARTASAGADVGVEAPIDKPDRLRGKPIAIVIVYSSNVPLTLRAVAVGAGSPAAPSASQTLGILPPTHTARTYLKLDEKLADRVFDRLQIVSTSGRPAEFRVERVSVTTRSSDANATLDLIAAN